MSKEWLPNDPRMIGEVPRIIHSRVGEFLGHMYAYPAQARSLAFTLPTDSHILPLVGKEIFTQLVAYHNTHPTPHLFVSPYTLMNFDPTIDEYRKTIKGGVAIQGEGIVPHEYKHYLEYQSLHTNSSLTADLLFTFYWEQYGYGSELKCKGLLKTRDKIPHNKFRSVYIAPTNPSRGDIQKYRRTLLTLNPFVWSENIKLAEKVYQTMYLSDDVDPEFLDTWLYRNKALVDSSKFIWNSKV